MFSKFQGTTSYIADEGLMSVVNAAIALRRPLLVKGEPGTGKTLLARAVAHHTDCTFIRVSGSELVQKYVLSTLSYSIPV